MPENLQIPITKTLLASGALTATGNTSNITLPLCDSYTIILDVTAASGTSPTLDVALQVTVDGGTTWYSVMRFAQLTSTGTQRITFQPIQGRGEASSQATIADTGGAATANQPLSQLTRFKYTIAGTSPSFTTAIYLIAQPRATAV